MIVYLFGHTYGIICISWAVGQLPNDISEQGHCWPRNKADLSFVMSHLLEPKHSIDIDSALKSDFLGHSNYRGRQQDASLRDALMA